MIQTKTFSYGKLIPAFRPDLAVEVAVSLPVGSNLVAGTVLAQSNIAARNEVRTIGITGSPTGSKLVITYTADQVYTVTLPNLVTTHATLAQVQTALESIFGTGNVAVTGTPGTTYTCTFQNALGNRDVGGTFAVAATFTAGSTPAAAWARTTQGSSGPAGQFVEYVDGGSNGVGTAKALLARAYKSDPVGGYVSEHGPTNQPFSPPAYIAGFFNCSDLTGLDANGVADLGRLAIGTAHTDTGSVLRM